MEKRKRGRVREKVHLNELTLLTFKLGMLYYHSRSLTASIVNHQHKHAHPHLHHQKYIVTATRTCKQAKHIEWDRASYFSPKFCGFCCSSSCCWFTHPCLVTSFGTLRMGVFILSPSSSLSLSLILPLSLTRYCGHPEPLQLWQWMECEEKISALTLVSLTVAVVSFLPSILSIRILSSTRHMLVNRLLSLSFSFTELREEKETTQLQRMHLYKRSVYNKWIQRELKKGCSQQPNTHRDAALHHWRIRGQRKEMMQTHWLKLMFHRRDTKQKGRKEKNPRMKRQREAKGSAKAHNWFTNVTGQLRRRMRGWDERGDF